MIYNVKTVELLYQLRGKVKEELLNWMELSLDCFERDYVNKEKDGDGVYFLETRQEFVELLKRYQVEEFFVLETICKISDGKHLELVYRLNNGAPLWIACPEKIFSLVEVEKIFKNLKNINNYFRFKDDRD